MGIFKAAGASIGGALGDQWLETIEPRRMENNVLATYGVPVRNGDDRNHNKKGTSDIISNGSIIHVPENVTMLLVDGGKIISATDEAGYYQVDNSRAPSMFFKAASGVSTAGYGNTGRGEIQRPGGFMNSINDAWERFKHGGGTPLKQSVIYINQSEIPGLRFGTKGPVAFADRATIPGRILPCKVTSFGTYAIRIYNALLFYKEIVGKTTIASKDLTKDDLNEQYLNEFLTAYNTALSSVAKLGLSIMEIETETQRIAEEMAKVLDKTWLDELGFAIQRIGIADISFDEKTDKLLERYGEDSLLYTPESRAGRMVEGLSKGLGDAGGNAAGSMIGFAGMNMGMNAMGAMGAMGALGAMPNQQPMQQQPSVGVGVGVGANGQPGVGMGVGFNNQPPQSPPATTKNCSSCGNGLTADAKFCFNCGTKAEDNSWTCSCGSVSEAPFCSNCGSKKPTADATTFPPSTYACDKCGWVPQDPQNPPAFCPNCGDKFDELDKQ